MPYDWLKTIHKAIENSSVSENLAVDNFVLKIQAGEKGIIDWVKRYLDPLALPVNTKDNVEYRYLVNCIYSDEVVSVAIDTLHNDSSSYLGVVGYGRRLMYISDSSLELRNQNLQVCISAEEGVIWVLDRSEKTLSMVYSSRTYWPSLEFTRTVRDLITHFLEIDGWIICHAGAVKTESENVMIIGGPGAGKTTLILALLDSGARYVANELLFAKPSESGLNVLPFAIPVAIGMGTALQFPKLTALLDKPYCSYYPPRRLDTERLAQKSHKDWMRLSDKLQLLPNELVQVFPSARPVKSISIDKIVVPAISKTPVAQKSTLLTQEQTKNIIRNNIISFQDKNFNAPWLKFELELTPETSIDLLLDNAKNLTALSLSYHVSKNSRKVYL